MRRVVVGSIVAAGVAVLAACGSSGDDQATAGSSGEANKHVNVAHFVDSLSRRAG